MAASLLDLPVELRLEVCSLCFGYEATALPRWQYAPTRNVALLRTCRTIYQEAMPIFYSQTTIVLNSWQLLPFPTTLNRHMRDAGSRKLLREVLIHDPLAMPYMYRPSSLPTERRATEWSVKLLMRHLPNLRVLTVSEVTPIVLEVSCKRIWLNRVLAVERYIRLQLTRTLALICEKGIQMDTKPSIFASARIQPMRNPCNKRDQEAHECEWQLPELSLDKTGQLISTIQLHPRLDECFLSLEEEALARDVFMRARIGNVSFLVWSL